MGVHLHSVHDRVFFDEAATMLARLGDDAVLEAATRANACESSGDLMLACRWRQVERAIQLLQLEDIVGEIH